MSHAPSTENGIETPEERDKRILDDRRAWHRLDRQARREVEQEEVIQETWDNLRQELNPDSDPTESGYPLMTLSKLRAKPKPKWKVEGVIAENTICVIGGPTNIGKTFVGVDLTAHIALGLKWEGRDVVQGRVAYLIAEGADFFPDRVTAWEQYNGQTVPEQDYLVYDGEDFNLSDSSAVQRMCATVARREIDVLVIDTLSQLGGLQNENDNVQMAVAVNAAVRIRRARPGCTVIIMHHANAQGFLRGAKSLPGDVDTVLMLVPTQKPKKADAADGSVSATFSLTTERERGGKQRNAATVTLPGWHLEDVGPSKVAVRLAMTHDPYQERILSVLADGEWHGAADFEKDWDDPSGKWSRGRQRTAMKHLSSRIEERGSTRDKQYRLKVED